MQENFWGNSRRSNSLHLGPMRLCARCSSDPSVRFVEDGAYARRGTTFPAMRSESK